MTAAGNVATIGELLAAVRDREGPAFDAPDRTTAYSSREFATTAWKAGNLLRHYGVRSGSHVAVAVGPKEPGDEDEPGCLGATPDPLLAALGATLLGGVVTLDPGEARNGGVATVDGDALVTPAAWLDRFEAVPGCARIAYGGPPAAPDVEQFEQATWSQNPVAPPEAQGLGSPDAAMENGDEWTHGDLLERASTVVEAYDIGEETRVAVRGRLGPDVFAAGVVAPLVAGATIVGGRTATPGRDGESEVAVEYVVGDGGDVRPVDSS